MDMNVLVNCLWLEGTYERVPYTPRQLSSATWTGAIVASLYHNLYFALTSMTDEDMITAAMATSRQLQELATSFLSSPKEAVYHNGLWKVPDIAVSVQALPVLGLPVQFWNGQPVLGSPPIHGAGTVVARAWTETPAAGAAEPFCVFIVATHTGSIETAMHGSGAVLGPQLSNYTLTNVEWAAPQMPYSHGTWQFVASTPFQAAPGRAVPILGTGDTRYIIDFLHPGETVVYQIGCHTEPSDDHWRQPLAPVTTNCGMINPSFEDFSIAGRPLGWDFGSATTDRDGRSTMLLDTFNPKHGRHALRVIVPTAVPLIFPFSSSEGHSLNPDGFVLKGGFDFSIRFWARSVRAVAGMRLDLLHRSGAEDTPDPGAKTGPAVGGASLTEEWLQITVQLSVPASSVGYSDGVGYLYLRVTGAGDLFLDHVQIRATKEGEDVSCS